jgi:hypothetical protein
MESEKWEIVDFRDDDVSVIDLINHSPLSKVVVN